MHGTMQRAHHSGRFLTAVALAAGGLALATPANAQLIFSFENGLEGDGFTYYQATPAGRGPNAPASLTYWESTNAVIDIGDGFNLLSATHGEYRIVIAPFEHRDGFTHEDWSMVLRSPTFEIIGGGDLQVDMMGGMQHGETANLSDPLHVGQLASERRNQFDSSDPPPLGDGIHRQGFALRDALTGEYVLWGYSSAANDGKARGGETPDPAERGVWDTVTISASQLAPYVDNGRLYQIDFFDSYGNGSWAWIGFDNVRVPGVLASYMNGDTNGDGMVDGGDIQTVFGNYTGPRSSSPVAKPDGLARIHGDFDGNGDVDGGDIQQVFGNFGSGIAVTSSSVGTFAANDAAWLIYDPSTGNVSIDTTNSPGGVVTSFRLLSDGGDLITGVVNFPSQNFFTIDLATEIFWSDPLAIGFSGVHELGAILESGLTLEQLQAALSGGATFTGELGSGVLDLHIVYIPEPASLALLGAGVLLITRRRRVAA